MTDDLFYHEYFENFVYNKEIYNDYDKLNRKIISRYGIVIPNEINACVCFSEGDLNVLDEARLFRFIDAVATLQLDKAIPRGTLSKILSEN